MEDIKLTVKSYDVWQVDDAEGEVMPTGIVEEADHVLVGEKEITKALNDFTPDGFYGGEVYIPRHVIISWQGKDVECEIEGIRTTYADLKKIWEQKKSV